MGSGRPTIIGKPGVEYIGERRGSIAVGGGGDVGRAGPEVPKSLSVGLPAMTEHVKVIRNDRRIRRVVDLPTTGRGIAGNQGAFELQKEFVLAMQAASA